MYQNNVSFEIREREARRIAQRYVGYLPLIVQPAEDENSVLEQIKYLVPSSFLFTELQQVIQHWIRKEQNDKQLHITMSLDKNIWRFGILNEKLKLADLFEEYHNQDGLLYVYYHVHSTCN